MTHSRPFMTRARLARGAAALALLTIAAAPLQAQRCLGFPGFGGQPLRLGGEITTGDDVTTLGANLAFGQAAGAFASVGLGMADADGVSGTGLLVNGMVGTQIAAGTRSGTSAGLQLCPVASIEYQSGPNVGDLDVSGLILRGGVSLGTSLPMTSTIALAPFGTASIAYARASVSSGTFDGSDSDVGGVIDLGAGLLFNNRFTIRPKVEIPIGFDDSSARFGVSFGFNFGGNR